MLKILEENQMELSRLRRTKHQNCIVILIQIDYFDRVTDSTPSGFLQRSLTGPGRLRPMRTRRTSRRNGSTPGRGTRRIRLRSERLNLQQVLATRCESDDEKERYQQKYTLDSELESARPSHIWSGFGPKKITEGLWVLATQRLIKVRVAFQSFDEL